MTGSIAKTPAPDLKPKVGFETTDHVWPPSLERRNAAGPVKFAPAKTFDGFCGSTTRQVSLAKPLRAGSLGVMKICFHVAPPSVLRYGPTSLAAIKVVAALATYCERGNPARTQTMLRRVFRAPMDR